MSASSRHVLLVEDEPGIMMTVALLLEMNGFRVTRAPNGLRALQELQLERPDIVVTDFMMPHMDGVGLIKAIREQPAIASLPVILTSAALPPDVNATEVAQGFLPKPYLIADLLAMIDSLLPTAT